MHEVNKVPQSREEALMIECNDLANSLKNLVAVLNDGNKGSLIHHRVQAEQTLMNYGYKLEGKE